MSLTIDHSTLGVSHSVPAPRATAPAAQVSRAFVFTDIVGSTELADRLGDRRFAAFVDRHNTEVETAAAAFGARAAQFLGDGYLIVFPHARAALDFAADLQRRMAALRGRLGLPVRIRIGINAGSAHITGSTFVGRNVIMARRLCEHARADEILVSARLCQEAGTFGAIRRRWLKGLSEPEPACALTWT